MPPKRISEAPAAPPQSAAKKAPRPSNTKKKVAPLEPISKKMKTKASSKQVTNSLCSFLKDPSTSANRIVDLILAPTCGLERIHNDCNKKSFFCVRSPVTAFLLAVEASRLDVVRLLVSLHSANINAVDDNQQTALHIAASAGSLDMVKYLVEECGLNALALDPSNKAPFDYAAQFRRQRVMEYLIQKGIPPLALHSTAFAALLEMTKYLLNHKCDVNLVNAEGQTPLMLALNSWNSDSLELTRLLLDNHANPNAVDNWGRTPLIYALKYVCDSEKAFLLLERGADPTYYSKGDMPLQLAIHYRLSDLASRLLELGAEPNISDYNLCTPLHNACSIGLVDVARLLIAKGALQDAANKDGKTPLDIAVASRNTALVSLFQTRLP